MPVTTDTGVWYRESEYAALEARCRELEEENAALRHDLSKSMANHVADINGSEKETFGEHGWTCASAKHLDMVTGNTGTMCRVCGEPHYSLETQDE